MQVLQMQGEYKHLKVSLEREVVMRSAKHVINRLLKEDKGESDLFLANVVTHLLNCLLAPNEFLTRLDQGRLKPADTSVQRDFDYRPGEIVPSPRKNSQVQQEEEKKEEQEKVDTAASKPAETKTAAAADSSQPAQ